MEVPRATGLPATVVPVVPTADEKEQRVRELEAQVKMLLEANLKKDLEIERLKEMVSAQT